MGWYCMFLIDKGHLPNIGQHVGCPQSSKTWLNARGKVSGHGFCFEELSFFWGDRLMHSSGKTPGSPCRGEGLALDR